MTLALDRVGRPRNDEIVIGLGGNVGTREEILVRFRTVHRALRGLGIVRAAPIYESAPIGGVEQAPFTNSALALATRHREVEDPSRCLWLLQELEMIWGRDRAAEVRWGQRTLDLDILLWRDEQIDFADLAVPHPRLLERRFALEPVVELLGRDYVLPTGQHAGSVLDSLTAQRVERVCEFPTSD